MDRDWAATILGLIMIISPILSGLALWRISHIERTLDRRFPIVFSKIGSLTKEIQKRWPVEEPKP